MALLSQVSTSYPRVPRDSFARTWAYFLIISLSRYGQFMLSTSFLPLHECWSLHCDLCPSHFHIHSGRLFRIISALSLSFHIYSIFYWKERNGLPLPFSFPATPVYSLTFPWTVHIHYPVRFSEVQALTHCFHIDIFHRNCIITVCDLPAEFVQMISSLVSYLFMTSGNFLFLQFIVMASPYASWQLSLLPRQSFFIFSEKTCFFRLDLFWKHCHPLHCIIYSKYLLSDRFGNDMLCSILFLSLGFNVLTDYFYCSACYWHFYKHW